MPGWEAWDKVTLSWMVFYTAKRSTFHSTSTHFFFCGAHRSLNKAPNVCVLHKSIISVALQCSSNSWQCPRICGWQHKRQHQTVLWSLSIPSCHGFVVQVPAVAVLAAMGLCSYGKHLETNSWCRIQWVWKYWSKYHLILMISSFTAPKILTRLDWADRPTERLCGDWWCSILNELVTTTAHKLPREWLQLQGQAIRAYPKQANEDSVTSWNS